MYKSDPNSVYATPRSERVNREGNRRRGWHDVDGVGGHKSGSSKRSQISIVCIGGREQIKFKRVATTEIS